MKRKSLGKTGLSVTEISFGALPIQRRSVPDAVALLKKAYQSGINYYDTARAYTDSEEKLGLAFSDVRKDLVLSTKTQAETYAAAAADIEKSLKLLQTDYIDLYQLHFIKSCPNPDARESACAALMDAKKKGTVRFVGITAHSLAVAREALALGVFDTVQFPLSYLSTKDELALADDCAAAGVGFIAMKALAGGLITNADAAVAFMNSLPHVVPIFGIQHEWELEAFLDSARRGVVLDETLLAAIEADRAALSGSFCRGCGYCLPCPADIPINWVNRMSLLLRRAPSEEYLSDDWNEKMHRVEHCLSCRSCVSRCPYELDIPHMLKENLADYVQFREAFLKNGK